jgi:N-acetylglucosaminyldiphosphoundecaprenol N-acetyl-beta-D-mannosaminyltransferase
VADQRPTVRRERSGRRLNEAQVSPAKADLLGVPISLVDLAVALDYLAGSIAAGRRGYVCTCPVYTVMMARERVEVGAAVAGAALAAPDGIGVVWALRLLGQSVSRVYGPDLMVAAMERGLALGWKHYLYGSHPAVAAEVTRRLSARFPGLRIVGQRSPPFRPLTPAEEAADVAAINAAQPDIVWVALGSPKQDLWCARHVALLDTPLLIGVGAAFDFLAGRVRQAPLWMRRAGLEWLFRLAMEPRRLWRRYLVYNPRFVARLGLELVGWGLRRRAPRPATSPHDAASEDGSPAA